MKKISFKTDDNVVIVGNFWKGSSNAVLLLHMMPATKESWTEFANLLNKNNFTVLAIDLRGHGESTRQNNEILNFRLFSDKQHQETIKDVYAAVDYLKNSGAKEVYIAGASIGANLALQYQAENQDIKKTIMMSAGLNYRGVLTEQFASKLNMEQSVFLIVGSRDDSADEMARQIANKIKGTKKVKIYESSSHGTDLFNDDKKLGNEMLDWLKGF